MSTTTTVSAEMEKLTTKRREAHIEVQKVRRDVSGYNAATESMRAELSGRVGAYAEEFDPKNHLALAGTDSAKLTDAIKNRMNNPNPEQGKYEAVSAKYQAAEMAERKFRLANFEALVSEVEPSTEDIGEKLNVAWQTILDLVDGYRLNADRVRDLVIGQPPLTGQDVAYDGRVDEWFRVASEALDAPLSKTGVSDAGNYKLAQARQAADDE